MADKEKIIEVKDLVKFYGDFKALDGIGFEVFKGDVFGFLGPNGAGKSTTLRILLGLVRPTSGLVRVFGNDISTDRRNILKRTGCIIEKPDFYNYLSAIKNIEIFSRISGYDIPRSKIFEMIEFVGLKGREKDKVKGYSHGMKQRLGLAQSLLHNPELIVLDEPTTGLDPQGILDIRNLIMQLKQEHNKTIILSSHILSEIELVTNRMVIINKGRTIVHGSVADLLNTSDMIVSITVDDVEKTLKIIYEMYPEADIQHAGERTLLLNISQEKIPELNQRLCKNDVRVYSIESKRKLEDYFLKLIEE